MGLIVRVILVFALVFQSLAASARPGCRAGDCPSGGASACSQLLPCCRDSIGASNPIMSMAAPCCCEARSRSVPATPAPDDKLVSVTRPIALPPGFGAGPALADGRRPTPGPVAAFRARPHNRSLRPLLCVWLT